MPVRRCRALLGPCLLFAFVGMVFSPTAAAHGPTVAVGEVSTRAKGADARTEQVFRALVSRELDRLRFDRKGRDESYVFSAALVRFDATTSRDGARATCVVSGVLRRANSGVIVAMMQGRGAAEDETDALEGAKSRALEAAVRGAVRHVPEAF
jgi:hypothetical protein